MNPIADHNPAGTTSWASYQQQVKVKDTNNKYSDLLTHHAYLQHIGVDQAKKVGHKEEDLIVDCWVGTKGMEEACEEVFGVTEVLHPEYFNCFSFAAKEGKAVDHVSLVLYLNNHDIPVIEAASR